MILSNFHTHTTYCDGKHTPEENVISAVNSNMHALGFSVHSYTPKDLSYCIKKEKISEYKTEINALKEKYADKINIYCGTELDVYSDMQTDGFDYCIGAVHYIEKDGAFLPVDSSAKEQLSDAEKYFGSDMLSYCEAYYETVKKIAQLPKAGFIAHFDLVSKFNENFELFDENSPRYKKAWQDAALCLLKLNIPFEINTGAIARGARKTPYPRLEIARFIAENGGKFILTSDCHDKNKLLCSFEEAEIMYKEIEILDFEPFIKR